MQALQMAVSDLEMALISGKNGLKSAGRNLVKVSAQCSSSKEIAGVQI